MHVQINIGFFVLSLKIMATQDKKNKNRNSMRYELEI